MEYLHWRQVRDMLRVVAQSIIDSKDRLTEADSNIGDGDHGIGMARGMQSALLKLDGLTEGNNVYELFQVFGKTLIMSMGGASGVLFGSLFSAGAKDVTDTKLDTKGLSQLFAQGLNAIKIRGHAGIGDKTMVDALEPAVQAMLDSAEQDLVDMLAKGALAAHQGAELTKELTAKVGRAKSLAGRSVGFIDAGALSVSILLRAMYDYVLGIPNETLR